MPSISGKPPYLPGLGGIRALAALAVLAGHAVGWLTPLPTLPGVYQPFARLTHCGLSAFFVLSGFVLQYNYGPAMAAGTNRIVRRFALARFARIYPLYSLLLLASMISSGASGLQETLARPSNLLAFLTLTQSWFFSRAPSLFPLAWAVSVEVFFYCLFPFAARLLGRLQTPCAVVCAGLGCLAAALALDAALATHWATAFAVGLRLYPDEAGSPEAFAGLLYQWLTYSSPYFRMWEFLLGMVTARLFVLRPAPLPGVFPAAGLALGLLLVIPSPAGAFFLGILEGNILYAPFLAAVLYATAGQPRRFLCGSLLKRLGAASLSIYLIQSWTLPLWRASFTAPFALGSVLAWTALALAGILLSLATGCILFRFVEQALGNWILSRISPRA